MTTNILSPETTKPEKTKPPIDKVVDFLEILSLLLLVISFGSLLVCIIGDLLLPGFAPEYENFFLLPIGLLCPIGAFTLLMQLLVIAMKRPSNCLRKVILAASIVALPVGLFFGFAIVIYMK